MADRTIPDLIEKVVASPKVALPFARNSLRVRANELALGARQCENRASQSDKPDAPIPTACRLLAACYRKAEHDIRNVLDVLDQAAETQKETGPCADCEEAVGFAERGVPCPVADGSETCEYRIPIGKRDVT